MAAATSAGMMPAVAEVARLKNYVLVRHLAMGGMGEVWLAKQEGPAGFSRPVVIKRVLPSLSADEQFVTLFLNEARLAARLAHPNVVQVIELAEDQGEWFLVMEYIHGRTLRALQKVARAEGKRLDPVFIAAVASQALVGLHYAHQLADESGKKLGLVHRDVSPDNLMVSFDGGVKVLDFGIAKASSAISTTHPGAVRGKLSYLSPEQIRGETLDGRSDVFAMGVVLYELLTGQRPFKGDSDAAKMQQVLQASPPPPAELDATVPRPLSDVVRRALSKDPGARYASAEAMHLALDAALASLGERISPSRLTTWMREIAGDPGTVDLTPAQGTVTFHRNAPAAPPPKVDRPVLALLAGVAVLVVLAGLVAWRVFAGPAPASPLELTAEVVVDAGDAADVDAGAEARTDVVPDAAVAVAPVEPSAAPDAGAGAAPVVEAAPKTRTGQVQFLVKPWAEVYLGTRSLGLTPMPPVRVPAGRQTFVLKNERLNAEKRVTVTVKPGQVVEVRESLLP